MHLLTKFDITASTVDNIILISFTFIDFKQPIQVFSHYFPSHNPFTIRILSYLNPYA